MVYNACIDNHHNVKLSVTGNDLKCCDTVSHLGSYIGRENNKANITKAIGELMSRANVLLQDMALVIWRLFTICLIHFVCFYGTSLWRLNNVHIKEFVTTWRKCLRKVLKVNGRTRSRYLPLLIGKEDILVQLQKRCAKL